MAERAGGKESGKEHRKDDRKDRKKDTLKRRAAEPDDVRATLERERAAMRAEFALWRAALLAEVRRTITHCTPHKCCGQKSQLRAK